MAVIGLVVRHRIESAVSLAQQFFDWAKVHGHTIIIGEKAAAGDTLRSLGLAEDGSVVEVSIGELVLRADPIITLGGDGTLLSIARLVNEYSPVFIGVNFGQLGFLTEISPAELISTLDQFFSGKSQIATRELLQVGVVRNNQHHVFQSYAINEAVISKGAADPLLNLDLCVDDELVMRLRADGMIVATPTGSTAYSLAAGGSIATPNSPVTLVTPLDPHSLTVRPLILPLDARVCVKTPDFRGSVWLTVDGQESFLLERGDEVAVQRSHRQVRFLHSSRLSYFQILRRKLNWGRENSPD